VSGKKFKPYHAWLWGYENPDEPDNTEEIEVGRFAKLSPALVNARVACQEAGINRYDWVVDKEEPDGTIINRRSSMGGFEPL
jgi:hypothetical protein